MISDFKLEKKRYTIGLLFGDFYGGYSADLFVNIVKVCRELGHNLLGFSGGFLTNPDPEISKQDGNFVFDLAHKDSFDGILVTGSIGNFISKEAMIQFLSKYSGVPIVNIGTHIEGMHNVLLDNQKGMIDLMNHLIEHHNYKNIAFMAGTEENYDAIQRFEAYKTVMNNHGITIDDNLVVNGNFSYKGGIKAFELLEKRKAAYDAVVCANDFMALSVIREMKKRGLSVPDNAAVTGFDDTEESWTTRPALTTIKQPFFNIAHESIKMLLALINGKETPQNMTIPTELIIRESCGCMTIDHLQYIKNSDIEKVGTPEVPTVFSDDKLLMNDLIQKIEHELPFLKNKINVQKTLSDLVDTCMKVMKGSDKKQLLEKFSTLFDQLLYKEEEVVSIYKLIRVFFIGIRNQFLTGEDRNSVQELWNETITLLGFLIKENQSEKKAMLKLESYVVYNINEAFVNTFDMDRLKDVTINNLPHFQFNSFYINLFDNQNRDMVRSLVAYDRNHQLDIKNEPFPATRLFPEKIDATKPFHHVILPLSYKDEHFGYIIYDISTLTCFVYQSLAGQIGGAIKGALLAKEVNENTIMLETKVAKRTLELEDANSKLKQLDTLKNDFIANITHDFRSPLTVILNMADLAMRFSDIGEEAKDKFRVVYQSSLRLKNTIDRLLELAKIDARGIKLKVEKVDLISYL
ncbi:MAG TPA: substrate-binding domain-containing protein, partial [Spirochaetota bacterium]